MMITMLCNKLFVIPFHLGNVYSTHAHPQTLFYHFASTRFNISAMDITRMCKSKPSLQRLQTLDKVEQFIEMLNKYGCSQVQIAKIMATQSTIITSRVETNLEPKIKLLEDFGFQGEALAKLLASNPSVLCLSLENELLSKMGFLKNLFQSQQFLIKYLLRTPRILSYSLEKTLKPSVALWERWGFQGMELLRLIRIDPSILQHTFLTPSQTDLIQEICPDKESNVYKYDVVTVAKSRMETLKAKIEHLKLCGLSVEETWQVCRVATLVLSYSKVKITKTMHFVVKDMELPANSVVKCSWLFCQSVGKIMKPKFLVWQKIKSMSDSSLSLFSVLMMTKARFVRYVIRGHPESTTLLTIYENAISNASNNTRSSIQC